MVLHLGNRHRTRRRWWRWSYSPLRDLEPLDVACLIAASAAVEAMASLAVILRRPRRFMIPFRVRRRVSGGGVVWKRGPVVTF